MKEEQEEVGGGSVHDAEKGKEEGEEKRDDEEVVIGSSGEEAELDFESDEDDETGGKTVPEMNNKDVKGMRVSTVTFDEYPRPTRLSHRQVVLALAVDSDAGLSVKAMSSHVGNTSHRNALTFHSCHGVMVSYLVADGCDHFPRCLL